MDQSGTRKNRKIFRPQCIDGVATIYIVKWQLQTTLSPCCDRIVACPTAQLWYYTVRSPSIFRMISMLRAWIVYWEQLCFLFIQTVYLVQFSISTRFCYLFFLSILFFCTLSSHSFSSSYFLLFLSRFISSPSLYFLL